MDDLFHEVSPLRQASREAVRELGILGKLGDLEISPAQCHAMIELGHHGVLTAGDLAEILRLDKSTMSRAVAALEKSGLIAVGRGASDKRRKPLSLTARGKKKLEKIHQRSNLQVNEALALLSEEERRTVVQGMSIYAKALARVRSQREFQIRLIEPGDDPYVAGIIRKVMPEFGADGPGFAIHDAEVDAMSAAYRGKKAGYFVVTRNGVIVGGGGFAPLSGAPEDSVRAPQDVLSPRGAWYRDGPEAPRARPRGRAEGRPPGVLSRDAGEHDARGVALPGGRVRAALGAARRHRTLRLRSLDAEVARVRLSRRWSRAKGQRAAFMRRATVRLAALVGSTFLAAAL